MAADAFLWAGRGDISPRIPSRASRFRIKQRR
jgi:hypothetical protein